MLDFKRLDNFRDAITKKIMYEGGMYSFLINSDQLIDVYESLTKEQQDYVIKTGDIEGAYKQ